MTSTSSATAGAVTSVDDMLANAKAAAAASASSDSSGTKSAVQKLLAAHPEDDTVQLSPVAQMLAAKTTAAAKTTYFDSDDYITAKVAQLKAQVATYTNLPGLDPSGGVLDGLTKEVNDLVTKQNAKLQASKDAAAAKQAELDKQNANAYKGVSSKDMLTRSSQIATTGKIADPTTVSTTVQAMLDKVKGSTVDTSA